MRHSNQKTPLFLLVTITLIVVIFFSACTKEPLKIGMIGSLTSKQSQLSIDARNAIELGVEEVNRSGGINGSAIELVVKDDGASTETALVKHQEFIDEGVHLVIGHMTSNMANAVLHSENDQLLFLSPSMSTEKLSTKDDFFLRTSPLTAYQGHSFMNFIENKDFKHITVIYDTMNRDYSESLALTVKSLGEAYDKMYVELMPFDSNSGNLAEVVDKVNTEDTECVFMISQATDTAYIAQKLYQKQESIMLFTVSWSMTQDLIHNGGKAVEGLYFVGVYHSQSKSEQLKNFERAFQEKYGYTPSFISVMAYDAFYVLVKGLETAESPNPVDVKNNLLKLKEFKGLEESFEMDEYGDCNRSYLIYQLSDGEFVPQY